MNDEVLLLNLTLRRLAHFPSIEKAIPRLTNLRLLQTGGA